MMSQKDAVYAAVVNVTGFSGDGACAPSKEQRAQINAILCEGFYKGTIKLDRVYNTPAELKEYVSGLISNWLRKDTRLNGGEKYQAKNPGSRAGSTDPQLKAMRALIAQPTLSSDDKAEIQSHIDARVKELQSAKQVRMVDYDALPADLKAKFRL